MERYGQQNGKTQGAHQGFRDPGDPSVPGSSAQQGSSNHRQSTLAVRHINWSKLSFSMPRQIQGGLYL
jgi:hypothetical protein